MNKNNYDYFLKECNKTPLSRDWMQIFGPITEGTIKQFNFVVTQPHSWTQALKFVGLLNAYLRQPPEYFDLVYRKFVEREEVPNVIRSVIDELITDIPLHLLIKKERAGLGIPIESGIVMKDSDVLGERRMSNEEEKAITRMTIYAGLTTNIWRQFLSYLLLFNYVMPITSVETQDLSEIMGQKSLSKLISHLFGKVKIKPLKRRQIDILSNISVLSEEVSYELVAGRGRGVTKSQVLEKALETVYSDKPRLSSTLEAVKKREARFRKKVRTKFKELIRKAKSITPSPPKIELG